MMGGAWQWAAGNHNRPHRGFPKMPTIAMAAFPRHTTSTSNTAWDGPANETRVKTGQEDGYYRRVYAWADPDGTKGTKAAYRFIHHQVAADGQPGAANVRACITGIAVLNGGRGGTTIPDSDVQGVYQHLAKHLRDAGVEPPELKAGGDSEPFAGFVVTIDGERWIVDPDGDWSLHDLEDSAAGEQVEELAVEPAATATAESPMLVPWSGVLCVEGRPTGDGRMFLPGSLEWDTDRMPFDLFAMLKDPDGGQGHAGAEVCGRIDEIWRTPGDEPGVNFIHGKGVYDTALEAGAEVVRLQRQKMLKGVSVDVDKIEVDMTDQPADDGDLLKILFGGGLDKFAKGRIRRATVCSIPAFIEATISPDDASLVAGAQVPAELSVFTEWADGDPLTVVASAAGERFTSPLLERPPKALFAKKEYGEYTPCTVSNEGVVSGHVIPWSECHIGFTDRCVLVTGSDNGYRYARTGHVATEDGDLVATARIYAQFRPGERGHADERLNAREAAEWYENMANALADVAIYDDEFGMQVQGRVRPGIDKFQFIALQGSDFSPDWRGINGKRECITIAAVNCSGYPSRYNRLPAIVASAAEHGVDVNPLPLLAHGVRGSAWAVDGQIVTLVASAARLHDEGAALVTAMAGRVEALEATVAFLVERDLEREAAAAVDGLGLDDLAAELEEAAAEALAGLEELEGNKTHVRRCKGCGALMSPDHKAATCGECGAAVEELAACSCDGACACQPTAAATVEEELAKGKPFPGAKPFPKKGKKDDPDDPDDDEDGDDGEEEDDEDEPKKKGRPFTDDTDDELTVEDDADEELHGRHNQKSHGGGAPKMPKERVSKGAGGDKDAPTTRKGMKGPRKPGTIDWEKRKREGKGPKIRPIKDPARRR